MLRVGLTGSIGVGKSFVTSIFEELGCHVLDADQTAREVVLPGAPGLKAITDEFGEEVLNPDGTLNRKQLGAIVFADENKRQLLNHLLHPFIIARQDEIMREPAPQPERPRQIETTVQAEPIQPQPAANTQPVSAPQAPSSTHA